MRDKDLRKALLMGVDFSMTGRNKPVHGRFRHTSDKSRRLILPETPAKAGLFRPTKRAGVCEKGATGFVTYTALSISIDYFI